MTVPPAPPFPEHLHLKMCAVVWCYTGDPARADALFEPVRALAPALHGVHPMPFPMLQSVFDALYPPGLQWYWRADFVRELGDEAIARHVEFAERLPTMHSHPPLGWDAWEEGGARLRRALLPPRGHREAGATAWSSAPG